MRKISGRFGVVVGVTALMGMLVAAAIASPAQTFQTLLSFDGTDGASPYAPLVQATNGSLYGTTGDGGANSSGTIFKITSSGPLTTLYNFCAEGSCADGQYPLEAGLVQATDGNLYGTTYSGGVNGNGTVFRITPTGKLTSLYSFCSQNGCADGAIPFAGLVQATDGNLYGTTFGGGNNDLCTGGCGTVFMITPAGALRTLHTFNTSDGRDPIGALVQATDGNFYGTTSDDGANGPYGTVFKITPTGTSTTLYSFDATDGAHPYGTLVQGTDGNLYGTTAYGGASNSCTNGCGTVFKITPSGTLTTLHSFDGTDGADPTGALIQATDGNLYGTSYQGGTNRACTAGCGTIFEITPGGTLTMLHSFDATDGASPFAGLVQDTTGEFYGTTYAGTPTGHGAVFRLSVGLGPFVKTLPASGKVGAPVGILGTHLIGATGVTFNGAAAVFEVVSSSLITTAVPTGATTGTVQVVTPGGTLSSNVPFQVRP